MAGDVLSRKGLLRPEAPTGGTIDLAPAAEDPWRCCREAAMSKHRLPLESPNWTPLTEVHRFVCEQTGDRRLAAQDLTDAMANGRVRSMRRQVDRLHDDEPERELLPSSFWATEYLVSTELQLANAGVAARR